MTANMAVIPGKTRNGAMSSGRDGGAHAKFLSSNKDKASQAEVKGLRELAKAHKQVAASIEKVQPNEASGILASSAARHGQDEG